MVNPSRSHPARRSQPSARQPVSDARSTQPPVSQSAVSKPKAAKPKLAQPKVSPPQVPPTPPPPQALKPAPATPKASRPASAPSPSRQPRCSPWQLVGAVVLLSLGIAGVAGSAWLGIKLIVNPQEVVWLNQVLPNWIPPIAGVKPPQTLDEIRVELRQSGSTLGEPIPLGSNTSVQDSKTPTSDVLIPILGRRSNCVTDCDHISALRVYQSVAPAANLQLKTDKTVRYQFVSQLAIAGPDEVFVIAPIVDARSGNQGSARSLPLTEIKRFEGAVPSTGVWLKLSGQWSRGNDTVKYGQVIRYNPQRFHLALLLDWTSPSGQDPVWQEVTGGGLPELIVNQTVGMEPHFQIYQVKPRNFLPNPIQLEPVSLLEAALDRSAYTDALQLARSGLWSTSEAWLKSLKHSGAWSAAAQAQLDLVKLHAQATKLQAENSWASPSEQILADLIDGRWNQALHVLEDSVENSQETIALLKSDSGQIRSRVEAALSTGSRDWEVKAWGALLIHAQKGPKAAIAWLKKQPQTTPADLTRIQRLMKTLS